MKVYFWDGEHHAQHHAGGWVAVTWAAAVDSLDDLRRLCADAGMKRPGKPYQSKPGQTEWKAAAARPGQLIYRNLESTGDESGDWQAPLADEG